MKTGTLISRLRSMWTFARVQWYLGLKRRCEKAKLAFCCVASNVLPDTKSAVRVLSFQWLQSLKRNAISKMNPTAKVNAIDCVSVELAINSLPAQVIASWNALLTVSNSPHENRVDASFVGSSWVCIFSIFHHCRK